MQEQLKNKLEQLRASLGEQENLDEDDVKLLQDLDRDILATLAGNQASEVESRVEQQAIAFEGQHPQLSGILRDVMDILSKMGI
jgi:hypothetical protein